MSEALQRIQPGEERDGAEEVLMREKERLGGFGRMREATYCTIVVGVMAVHRDDTSIGSRDCATSADEKFHNPRRQRVTGAASWRRLGRGG